VDPVYAETAVYYKIGEIGSSGKISYSAVTMVGPQSAADKIVLFPVPVISSFTLGNIARESVKSVQVIALNGTLQAAWSGYQDTFDISNAAAGIYNVKISLSDGTVKVITLTKK
jgi:hypothetical protein